MRIELRFISFLLFSILTHVVIAQNAETDNLSDSSREQLFQLLTEKTVKEIAVLDEQPEELYINKRWTGLIAMVLSDKKITRKLKKIKLE